MILKHKKLHSITTPRKNNNASHETNIMVTEEKFDVSRPIDLNNNTIDQRPALSAVGNTMCHATTSWSLNPQQRQPSSCDKENKPSTTHGQQLEHNQCI